jgi:hypothetical protein
VEELEDLPFGDDLVPAAQQELQQGKLPGVSSPSTSLATPCGCRNPFTSGDLGILVDQSTESIQPCDPDTGW